MKQNQDLMDDFWRRVRGWNGYKQECFIGVRQVGEWLVMFRTPDGLECIYDGLHHTTRRVFDSFEEMDEEWFAEEIRCNIEYYMMLNGYNIDQLAQDVGVSTPTLYSYLNGQTWPRVDVLFRMAKVLGCTPDDLFYVESRYK